MDNVTTTTTPAFERPLSEGSRKKRNPLPLIILIVLILVAGGFYLASRSQDQKVSEVTVSPTEEPEATPTEEVSPTPDEDTTPSPSPRPTSGVITEATEMNIQVLNGSGVVGAAADGAAHLRSQGYTNVTTDNADNSDFEGVTVQIKSSRNKFLSTLLSDLQEKYASASAGSTLADSSDFDAIVIIGK